MSGNPFNDREVVTGYERWYETVGRRADRLEKALVAKLLGLFPAARTALEVGCGTGHFARWLASRGLRTAGCDISPAMLDEAGRLGTRGLVLGDALRLPFSDCSHDVVVMITTLEFVADPATALREALRVARHGLILGVLNGRSLLGRQLKREGGPIWDAAHFFTPEELTRDVKVALSGRSADLTSRTTLWPLWPRDKPLPWGGFIGMAVKLRRVEEKHHDRDISSGQRVSLGTGGPFPGSRRGTRDLPPAPSRGSSGLHEHTHRR